MNDAISRHLRSHAASMAPDAAPRARPAPHGCHSGGGIGRAPRPALVMSPLEMVGLGALMSRTRGEKSVRIGLIDGPVAVDHPDLAGASIEQLGQAPSTRSSSAAVAHGTAVAGILVARRGGEAPAICPDCTLLVRPIFGDPAFAEPLGPTTTPLELAGAIHACLDARARVLNLSAAMPRPSASGDRDLSAALDRAAHQGALVVAAAGNQGALGSTPITRHPGCYPSSPTIAPGVQPAIRTSGARSAAAGSVARATALRASGSRTGPSAWEIVECQFPPDPRPPPPPPPNCGCGPGRPCCPGNRCCPVGAHCCSDGGGCCKDGWACRSFLGHKFCSPV